LRQSHHRYDSLSLHMLPSQLPAKTANRATWEFVCQIRLAREVNGGREQLELYTD